MRYIDAGWYKAKSAAETGGRITAMARRRRHWRVYPPYDAVSTAALAMLRGERLQVIVAGVYVVARLQLIEQCAANVLHIFFCFIIITITDNICFSAHSFLHLMTESLKVELTKVRTTK